MQSVIHTKGPERIRLPEVIAPRTEWRTGGARIECGLGLWLAAQLCCRANDGRGRIEFEDGRASWLSWDR